MVEHGRKMFGTRYIPIDYGDSYTIPKSDSDILDYEINFELSPFPLVIHPSSMSHALMLNI